MSTTNKTAASDHIKCVQAAYYAIENPDKTVKQVARKFSMSIGDVEKSVERLHKGTLLKKNTPSWNPLWESPNYVFHPDDNYIQRDIELGVKLNSTLIHGFFDLDYDPINGGYHLYWGEKEVLDLAFSLPQRVLEILRDSSPDSEDYKEALLFLDSDFCKAICITMGMDHEELIRQTLLITKADI